MKHSFISAWLMIIGSAAIAAIAPNQEQLAKVASGELKEARLSWWGFDENDSSDIIKSAIESKATTIVVDKMPTPWITLPVFLKSDMTLVFEDGAEMLAKKDAFKGLNDCLITIMKKSNVKIIGLGEKGGILRMHKKDYQGPDYKHGEWRHGITMHSSENVHIENMSIIESGGDGIYVGVASRLLPYVPYSKDVVIRKVNCDHNHRQGISVIAAVNLLIEDTRMANTDGTSPKAGIDFEPNRATEPLQNCVMRNCISEGNDGAGYDFYLPNQDSKQCGPISITLENCISRNNRGASIALSTTHTRRKADMTWEGTITFKNCDFTDQRNNARFRIGLEQPITIAMENCKLNSTETNGLLPAVDIEYSTPSPDGKNHTQVSFDDLFIAMNRDGGWLNVSDRVLCGLENYNVKGSNIILTSKGKTETVAKIDEDYLEKQMPGRRDIAGCKMFDPKGKTLIPANPKGSASLPNAKCRSIGYFWIYTTKGEPATFTLHYAKLTRYKGKFSIPELTYPSGKKVQLEPIEFDTKREYIIASPEETGICELTMDVVHNWATITNSSVPAGILLKNANGTNIIYTVGTYYFDMPVGTPHAAISLLGEGGEGCKATIIDPNGKTVFSQDDICNASIINLGASPVPGIWSLILEKPTNASLEDFCINLLGVPPYLTNDKAVLPRLIAQ
ncbi:MAG: right-handed parallel beta-helix repeat-containing protein [Victivallales bacterium]|nr:right-handed parallel beta-helix repeat-containing protein [Victivallales bacterium]